MNWTAENLLKIIRQGNGIPDCFSLNVTEQFLEIGRLGSLPANEPISNANTRLSSLYIPLSGQIYGFEPDQKNPRAIYEKGTLIGLSHALANISFPYQLSSLQTIDILIVPLMHLRSLIEHDSNIRWQIIEYMGKEIAINETSTPAKISNEPPSRLAAVLLELAKLYGEPNQNEEIQLQIKISQEELGSRIGVSRQSTNKYIHDFIEKGYIKKLGHRYHIIDIEGLETVAEN